MQGFNVEIRYLKRSRRATIRVLANKQIRVSVPRGFSTDEVTAILQKKTNWILRTHKMLEALPVTPVILWQSGQTLPFFGQQLELKIFAGFGQVTISGSQLLVPVPPAEDEKTEYAKWAVIEWYKAQALLKLAERCRHFAEKLGVNFKKLSIKSYKSRWGACSSRGELVFNWQILIYTPELFDYVVAHEICHLKEMNHSPRFYGHLISLGFERRIFHPRIKMYKNIF